MAGYGSGSPGVSVWSAPEVAAALVVFFGLAGPVRLTGATVAVAVVVMTVTIVVRCLEHTAGTGPGNVAPQGTRLLVGLVLGLLLLGGGLIRLHAPHRLFTSPFDPLSVESLQGRLLHDLRPGTSPFRRVEIEAMRVATRRGWSGSASGRVIVMWQGTEYLDAGDRRIMPVRGDTVTVLVPGGLEINRSPAVIWADDQHLSMKPAPGLPSMRRAAREWIRARLARLDPVGGPMVLALLLGDRGALSPELADDVRRSGASHVLALSGMHLGVLALILYRGPLRLVPPTARGWMILPLLLVYVWIAGWIPSLVRALVLVLVATIPRMRSVSVPMPLLLARTVVVVGVVSPETAGNLGFQLSVLALVGIVVISPGVVDRLTPIVGRRAGVYLGVTVAAMIPTAPLSLGVFGSVYPAGVLLAGVLSALIVVQMWLGVAFLGVAGVPVVGTALGRLIQWNTRVVGGAASLGGRMPAISMPTIGVPAISIPAILTEGIEQAGGTGIGIIPGVIVFSAPVVLWLALRLRGRRGAGSYPEKADCEPQLDF